VSCGLRSLVSRTVGIERCDGDEIWEREETIRQAEIEVSVQRRNRYGVAGSRDASEDAECRTIAKCGDACDDIGVHRTHPVVSCHCELYLIAAVVVRLATVRDGMSHA
jgi:hypothetical protein